MRPVNKGPWPTHGHNNVRYIYNNWANASPFLKNRTGWFCHLCEIPLTSGSAVEHIKSRNEFPRLSNSWTNFLLICVYCNSRKGAAEVIAPYRKNYYWPHIANTLLAYSISTEQLVEVGCGLDPDQKERAQRLINLYKLNESTTDDGAMDQRHRMRTKAFTFASRRLEEYLNGKCTIQAIVDSAVSSGFFSLWYQVFSNHPPVLRALIEEPEFYLDLAWFDAILMPVARNAVNPIDL